LGEDETTYKHNELACFKKSYKPVFVQVSAALKKQPFTVTVYIYKFHQGVDKVKVPSSNGNLKLNSTVNNLVSVIQLNIKLYKGDSVKSV